MDCSSASVLSDWTWSHSLTNQITLMFAECFPPEREIWEDLFAFLLRVRFNLPTGSSTRGFPPKPSPVAEPGSAPWWQRPGTAPEAQPQTVFRFLSQNADRRFLTASQETFQMFLITTSVSRHQVYDDKNQISCVCSQLMTTLCFIPVSHRHQTSVLTDVFIDRPMESLLITENLNSEVWAGLIHMNLVQYVRWSWHHLSA